MNKKLLAVALILAMVFAFSACGGGGSGESSDSQDSGTSDIQMMGESVDLISSDEGEIQFIGFQKADPKLVEEENAYVFVFEYTNHKDDPSQFQNTFWIQYFQNGSELTNSVTFNSAAQEQYDLVSASNNEALKDGTVRFGQIVIPKDDSPVTVMAKEQYNQDHYEMVEVNLKDGTVAAEKSNSSEGPTDTAEIESMLQGEWSYEANSFLFDNGSLSVLENGAEVMSGEYSINTDDSTIVGTIHASDGDVKITLPYTMDGGVLHIQNNKGEELTHK